MNLTMGGKRSAIVKQIESHIRGLLPFFAYVVFLSIWIVFGCTDPKGNRGPYNLDDEALLPFAAMYQVDREQFCLTEIVEDSKIEIRRADSANRGYDIALHVHNDRMYRSVFFVRENDQYVWIGEQEIHRTGRYYSSIDGILPEEIVITYYEREVYGGIPGLIIAYHGDDASIPRMPTCDQALSYIREWSARRTETDNQ
jgi:hypothetical protein